MVQRRRRRRHALASCATSTRGRRTRSACCRWCARRSPRPDGRSRSSTASRSARGPDRSPAFASAAASRRDSRSARIFRSIAVPDARGARAGSVRRRHGWTRGRRVSRCADARGLRRRCTSATATGGGNVGAPVGRPPPRCVCAPARCATRSARAMASPRIRRSRRSSSLAAVDADAAADGAVDRRARAAAARRGRGRRRRRRAAALRAPPRGADDRRARRRRALVDAMHGDRSPLLPARRCREWRPLRDGDLAYVAALEAQIHAAPWTIGNFRDALAAGYCGARRRARGPHRRVRRADAGARRSADPQSVGRAGRAARGPRPRAAAPLRRRRAATSAPSRSSSKCACRTSPRSRCTSPRASRRSRAASATIPAPAEDAGARTRS